MFSAFQHGVRLRQVLTSFSFRLPSLVHQPRVQPLALSVQQPHSLVHTLRRTNKKTTSSSQSSQSSSPFTQRPLTEKAPQDVYDQVYETLRNQAVSAVKPGQRIEKEGDDYSLQESERQNNRANLPGLVEANLLGTQRRRVGAGGKAPPMRVTASGGRKSSIAKVWMQPALVAGCGEIYVNGMRYAEYFTTLFHRWSLCAPLYYTGTLGDMDVLAVVRGGGKTGQAGAIKNATAKALVKLNKKRYKKLLQKQFLTTRDERVVERKKYGQRKARAKYPFVKR